MDQQREIVFHHIPKQRDESRNANHSVVFLMNVQMSYESWVSPAFRFQSSILKNNIVKFQFYDNCRNSRPLIG